MIYLHILTWKLILHQIWPSTYSLKQFAVKCPNIEIKNEVVLLYIGPAKILRSSIMAKTDEILSLRPTNSKQEASAGDD